MLENIDVHLPITFIDQKSIQKKWQHLSCKVNKTFVMLNWCVTSSNSFGSNQIWYFNISSFSFRKKLKRARWFATFFHDLDV